MSQAIHIKTKNANSRFVAIDTRGCGTVVAEGRTAKTVMEKAGKSGKRFSMMYIPPKRKKHIGSSLMSAAVMCR